MHKLNTLNMLLLIVIYYAHSFLEFSTIHDPCSPIVLYKIRILCWLHHKTTLVKTFTRHSCAVFSFLGPAFSSFLVIALLAWRLQWSCLISKTLITPN